MPSYRKKLKKTMMKEPDPLEEGFWTILGFIFVITAAYTLEKAHLVIIGFTLILLVTATIFWSYAQRLK